MWITPQAEYLVMCMGMIKVVEDPKISKWIFDDARNNALKQENGKLLSERDLNLNGHVGREFIVEAPKGVFMDRVYLVKDRFYLISAFIPVAQPAEKAMASKILDSFKFIERTEAVVK